MDFIIKLMPLVPFIFILVALSQLVLGILSKLGKKPKISFFPGGQIEVGFSIFGPTLTLFGTLRASHADAFVSRIELKLIGPEISSPRIMEWRVFKPYTFGFAPQAAEQQYELVSAFLLSPLTSFKNSIVFVDDPFIEAHTSKIVSIQSLWEEFNKEAGNPEAPAVLPKRFDAFYKTPEVQQVVADLERVTYWKAGEYRLDMRIHTSNPDKTHTFPMTFHLSEENADILDSSLKRVAQLMCGLEVSIRYVYSKLNTDNKPLGS